MVGFTTERQAQKYKRQMEAARWREQLAEETEMRHGKHVLGLTQPPSLPEPSRIPKGPTSPVPSPPSLDYARRDVETAEKELERRAAEAKKTPTPEKIRKYEKFYHRYYKPAFRRYSTLHKAAMEGKRRQAIRTIRREAPELHPSELESIEANLLHIWGMSPEKQAVKLEEYMGQWEPVIEARREAKLERLAWEQMETPLSLLIVQRAEEAEGRGPLEWGKAQVGKVGGLIIGAGEELYEFGRAAVEGRVEGPKIMGEAKAGPLKLPLISPISIKPRMKKIETAFGTVEFPASRPPLSPVSSFLVPEYRKYAPYGVVAGALLFPLEVRAFGAGVKAAKGGISAMYRGTTKTVFGKLPPHVKTYVAQSPKLSRLTGISEVVRVKAGGKPVQFGYYSITERGSARITKLVYWGKVKPAGKPTYIPKSVFEAQPKRAINITYLPERYAVGMRAFSLGKKEMKFAVFLGRAEPKVLGGLQAISPQQVARRFILPQGQVYFPAPLISPMVGGLFGTGAAVGASTFASFRPRPAVRAKKWPSQIADPFSDVFRGMAPVFGVGAGTGPSQAISTSAARRQKQLLRQLQRQFTGLFTSTRSALWFPPPLLLQKPRKRKKVRPLFPAVPPIYRERYFPMPLPGFEGGGRKRRKGKKRRRK